MDSGYQGEFCLVQDDDGHWYVIPEGKLNAWSIWVCLSEDCQESDEVPDYARPVNGAPCRVRFDSWVLR